MPNTPDGPRRCRALALTSGALAVVLAATSAMGGKVETWRQERGSDFSKGKRERVVVTDSGRIRLAQAIRPTETLDAARVWDLVRAGDGAVFAATGDGGKVFRRAGDGPWTLVYDANDTQALALAVGPEGHVFVGTGPSGQVVDVTAPDHPASRPDPSVQYIWDLAADAEGNLYAATGPTGQLWKRTPKGAWSLLLDSKHPHLLCVAVGPDRSVYAGSDGEGLIYRVGPDGKASIVYDAPQSEVRSVFCAPDGLLYAGTAVESGGPGGGGSGRGPLVFSAGEPGGPGERGGRVSASTGAEPAQKKDGPRSSPSSGGTASPRPTSPGENVVYKIDADGVPREVFRARALVFALARQGDRLLVGTGPEGQLYEVRDDERESAPLARLDHGQVLALLADPKGDVLIGAGDPGAVVRLAPGHSAEGTLTSDVHDAKYPSRFGALGWTADVPKGTSVAFRVRSGNVGEPDETWSDWSSPQAEPGSSTSRAPLGRFVQWRATLATEDPAVTPEVRSVTLRYQTANLPPEITKVDVPDLAEGDGATRQTKLTLRWDVNDPNGDDLAYTLHLRKDGWPDWVELGEGPLTEKSFSWDTTAVPAGTYRVRVTATDRPSNGEADALARDRVSEPFLVDHQAPTVTVSPDAKGATVTLKDDLTRLVKAAYALDGGDWVPIFPDDRLFDQRAETVTIALPDLKPGTHILTVRATDAAGNVGAGDAVLTSR